MKLPMPFAGSGQLTLPRPPEALREMMAPDRIGRTRNLPDPNFYVRALLEDYADWAFCEERAPLFHGAWRKQVFDQPESVRLDLEVGTGNGYHFAHYAKTHPDRLLLGIERKYKPLIQSIRRARRDGAVNARMIRYHANYLSDLFDPGELNDVHIHFPDPWIKLRQNKNRLIQKDFLQSLFERQRPEGRVFFKTDNREYFDHTLLVFKGSPYQIEAVTYDLHGSPLNRDNFITHFERLFLKQGLPIHFLRARRPE